MSKVLQHHIDQIETKKPQVTRKRSRVSANCLHSPEKLCAYEDERVRKKKRKKKNEK
jgi:hypothetical protein